MLGSVALSIGFCVVLTARGLGSECVYDLPSGPTIIVLAGAAGLLVVIAARVLAQVLNLWPHPQKNVYQGQDVE